MTSPLLPAERFGGRLLNTSNARESTNKQKTKQSTTTKTERERTEERKKRKENVK